MPVVLEVLRLQVPSLSRPSEVQVPLRSLAAGEKGEKREQNRESRWQDRWFP